MIKKAFAAIALAGTLLVLAPQAGFASDTPLRQPTSGTLKTTDYDLAAKQAFADIEQRLVADPLLARQVQRAASVGDSDAVSSLLSTDGTEVVAVGSSTESAQLDSVRIRVTVTVCVRVWGTTYCGTVIVTVEV